MKWAIFILLSISCSQVQRKIADDGKTISIAAIRSEDYRTFHEEFKKNPEKLYEKLLADEVDPRFFDIIAHEYFAIYKSNPQGLTHLPRNSETFFRTQILLLIKDSLNDELNIRKINKILNQLPPMKHLVDESRISLSIKYNENSYKLMKEALEKEYFMINTEAMSFAENFFITHFKYRSKEAVDVLIASEKYFVPVFRQKFLELLLANVSLVNNQYLINTIAARVYEYFPRTESKSLYNRHIVLRLVPEESRAEHDLVHRLAKRTSDLKTRDALMRLLEIIPPSSFDVKQAIAGLEKKFDISYLNILIKALERDYFLPTEKPREIIEALVNSESIPNDARLKLLVAGSQYFEGDKNLFIEKVKEIFPKAGNSSNSLLEKFLSNQKIFTFSDFESILPKKLEKEIAPKQCTGLVDIFMGYFRGKK
jgi:hypothetical protein